LLLDVDQMNLAPSKFEHCLFFDCIVCSSSSIQPVRLKWNFTVKRAIKVVDQF